MSLSLAWLDSVQGVALGNLSDMTIKKQLSNLFSDKGDK